MLGSGVTVDKLGKQFSGPRKVTVCVRLDIEQVATTTKCEALYRGKKANKATENLGCLIGSANPCL